MNIPRADFKDNLFVALDTLRANKLRSFLTILGIVIGVTSVISVAAIITGLNGFIQEKVESLGSRTYFLSRIPAGPRFGALPEKYRVRKYFSYDDAAKIQDACPSVETVTTLATRAAFFGNDNDIRYKGQVVERIIVRGAEPQYVDVLPLFAIEEGRFLNAFDEQHARQVAVIGQAIVESLFPGESPVGKEVRINGSTYEVIGTFAHDQGLFGGPGVDQFAIIPLSDFKRKYPDMKELFLAFTIRKEVPLEEGRDQVEEAVRRIRRVRSNQENDFDVTSPDFLSNLWNQLTGALVILTSVISSVGLLVGGVGVMNIMLISVTERTAEIGVRKAMGARRSDIRIQFLFEALTLTMIGGVLGLIFGAAISFLVRSLVPDVPAALSYFWVGMGLLMSAATGIFFGYYPADRAANLDPIECLRYE